MSFAYMPLYTGDYGRDTRHLTPEEHGAYILLLMHCWDAKGPVPLDERRQFGLVNARSGGEIESLRRVLAEFFVKMEDGWYNKRISEEIAKWEQISAHRRRGGFEKARKQRDAVRAQAQHEHSMSTASALLEQVSPSPSPSPTSTSKETSTTKSGKPDVLAQEVLNFLNNATGRKYRPVRANLKPIAARIAETSVEHCKAVICDRTAKWKNDPKMDEYLRPATLFGAQNFHQYLPGAEKAFFDQQEEL